MDPSSAGGGSMIPPSAARYRFPNCHCLRLHTVGFARQKKPASTVLKLPAESVIGARAPAGYVKFHSLNPFVILHHSVHDIIDELARKFFRARALRCLEIAIAPCQRNMGELGAQSYFPLFVCLKQ